MASAIRLEDLKKTYRSTWTFRTKQILHGLDLDVPEGRIFGFLGPNGAGKTTTIKILVGLVRPSSGRAMLLGRGAGTTEAMRQVGFLPENPYFYEYLTPDESLHFYGSLYGLRGAERKTRVEALLEEFDLARVRRQRIRTFSKGMRQRLGMAQALVGNPRLVILDEPQSGLDPIGRYQIKEAILRLRRQGVTVFFSSHVLGDVEDLCDDIGLLVAGRLAQSGPLARLLASQSHSYELRFHGVSDEAAHTLADSGLQGSFTAEAFSLRTPSQAEIHPLLERVHALGGRVVSIQPLHASLEEYFVRMTQASS